MCTIWWIPVVSAVGALISAAAAWAAVKVQSSNTKRQISASLRQEWINGLRKNIGDFIASTQGLIFAYEDWLLKDPDSELPQSFLDRRGEMESTFAQIQLRLDPKQDNAHKEMIEKMFKYATGATAPRTARMGKDERKAMEQTRNDIVELAKRILDSEREKIRDSL